jgi:hypothetical protein
MPTASDERSYDVFPLGATKLTGYREEGEFHFGPRAVMSAQKAGISVLTRGVPGHLQSWPEENVDVWRHVLEEFETHTVSANTRSHEKFLTSIKLETARLKSDHELLIDKASRLERNLTAVREQNDQMKELLSAEYSSKALFLGMSAALLGFLASLAADYYWDVRIIHPLLAYGGISVSLGFAVLAMLRRASDSRGDKS